MEISTSGRPRNVGWLRAAALLYGDWGTSKTYVVGLGLALAAFSSLPLMLAVCALTALVGVNYIWVCKFFPAGGGVYNAARPFSKKLAVIGALLLVADYIVTASLSSLTAFYYLGFTGFEAKKWAITALFAIGAVNFFGPKHTGSLAVYLALPTVVVVVVLICAGFTHWNEIKIEPLSGSPWHHWKNFVGMILALSGVEAIANTTGVMRLDPGSTQQQPSVHRTARRAIIIVMLEVVLGTALLSWVAMALPEEATRHTEDLLNYMAAVFVGPWFSKIAGILFALLLLSAVNTAMVDLVAIPYMMARDKELPRQFSELNPFGVPWLALIFATMLPVLVLNIDDSVEGLAALYAIGVVGAITINIGSCSFNKALPMERWQRVVMTVTFLLLASIWFTIAATKLTALIFVLLVLGIGLALREATLRRASPAAKEGEGLEWTQGLETTHPVEAPSDIYKILVAARGWTAALEWAIEEARLRGAQLYVLYIREVRVAIETGDEWLHDPAARALFERLMTHDASLRIQPLYSSSNAPAETILETVQESDANLLILGGSRRSALVHLLKGNVITEVASRLSEKTRLIIVG